jgi:wyosine [tRNA(Phe)-imidazoG37] synthetase (radical SAM superfamily)
MALSTPLFTTHSREWRSNRYVYPVISRRSHGLSIGINLNPDKACNFDCVYCSVDRSVPGPGREVDLAVLRRELRDMLQLADVGALFAEPPLDATPIELRRLNDVAFSGDGEPTAAVEFGAAAHLAAEVIAEASVDCRIVVITNATLLRRPGVATTLAFLDRHRGQVWAKLDAGSESYYQRVERSKIPLATVLANITACARVRPLVIQSLFMRLAGEPPTSEEIASWCGRLRDIRDAGGRIELVQVYTTARPAAESFVSALEDAEIDRIVAAVRELGFSAEGFYGVTS